MRALRFLLSLGEEVVQMSFIHQSCRINLGGIRDFPFSGFSQEQSPDEVIGKSDTTSPAHSEAHDVVLFRSGIPQAHLARTLRRGLRNFFLPAHEASP